MDFSELKSNWQTSGNERKSQAELQMMTKVRNHPKLKRIRIKLIIETILLLLFLTVYNNIFDGENKPLWVTIVLITSAILFVLNDISGFLTLQKPITGSNLIHSMNKLFLKLKRVAVFSLVSSLIFGLSIILFLTSTINFTSSKYIMLAGMLITLIILTYLSYQSWLSRINHLKRVVAEFDGNA